MAGGLSREEVRLYRFPSPAKERPVVVLPVGASCLTCPRSLAPMTSTIRGVASEVVLDEKDGMKRACAINLHGVITVRRTSLGRRLVQLGPERMEEICRALAYALECTGGADEA